jgi:predicted flap endonuclease-1-like 5' DNA nuclease
MSVEVIIAFVVGLIVGILATWYYWRQRIADSEAELRSLHAAVATAEQDLAAQRQAHEAELERLQGQVDQKEATLREQNAQLEWRKLTIDQLREEVTARESQQPQAEAAPLPTRAPAAPVKPDNLKRIEGIGPKIAQLLNEAGIVTFAQLAATQVDRLDQILEQAGSNYQLADPSTWPEQARLAAAEDWQALTVLQDRLKGGRRE